MRLTRRAALLGLTSAVSLSAAPRGRASLAVADAPTRRRLVVVLLRGALDGMAAVVPYGDSHLAEWRRPLLPPEPGSASGQSAPGRQDPLQDMGGFFGLHAAMPQLGDMYRAGEMLVVHAVGGPDRSRSHFEAQDSLECGIAGRLDSGWLNRATLALHHARALSLSTSPMLMLRGPAQVASWMPPAFQHPPAGLYLRVAEMHAADPLIGPAIAHGLRERGFSEAVLRNGLPPEPTPFAMLASAAGRLLAADDGPRLAALEIGGWDSHLNQIAMLRDSLGTLDTGLAVLRASMGEAWAQTAVLVMTEFGRTVRVNGSVGTDHGTGTVAFVLGGAVAGGRVVADWPGLAETQLYENRDLMPTTDTRAVAKGLLAQHLGFSPEALEATFPESRAVAPLGGLLRG